MAPSTLPSTASALLDLPTELQLDIIDLVADEDFNFDDLVPLALSCKHFNDLCELKSRREFRTITIREFRHTYSVFDRLLDILRTPRLAGYVRRVELNMQTKVGTPFINEPPTWERTDLPDSDVQLLRRAVNKAGFEGQQARDVMDMLMQRSAYTIMGVSNHTYRTALERGNYIGRAIGTILLSECRNLEYACIGAPPASHLELNGHRPRQPHEYAENFPLNRIMKAIHEAPTTCGFMSKVRTIELFSRNAELCARRRVYDQIDIIGRMEIFNGLPALKTIVVEGAAWNQTIPRFTTTTNVATGISIQDSLLGSDVLAGVIFSIAKLEDFTYHTGNRIQNESWYDENELNPCTLFKFLLSTRHTLKRLDLNCDAQIHTNPWIDYRGIQTSLGDYRDELMRTSGPYRRDRTKLRWIFALEGCLADFTALTKLTIGADTLFLFLKGSNSPFSTMNEDTPPSDMVRALPPKLKHLKIVGRFAPFRGRNARVHAMIERMASYLRATRPDIILEGIFAHVRLRGVRGMRALPADVREQIIGP
ncbi:uncharacterized protein DSM5745_02722 [Aspergillus mulundensis]|uniref:F-box domain-containing protein n=1 Tax=Aspergillus mulundensis TaxID=1810919 RepID=A0A3D8SIC6_9EURO|nr:hypothetical protein DSM5745_02722 [Aspergillus mulundensis]RDW86080.1 hypothetical protein DSM5745_02722 [Aspergillus mulundensis]